MSTLIILIGKKSPALDAIMDRLEGVVRVEEHDLLPLFEALAQGKSAVVFGEFPMGFDKALRIGKHFNAEEIVSLLKED